MKQFVIDHRGQQIIRCGYRVDVSGEIEIERFHRHDLRISAACCATFDPECRSLRRLSKADDRAFADELHRLAEADERC